MATFWIAAVGGSATHWLARTLDHSPTHTVKHEDAEPKGDASLYWRPFPLDRFCLRYGECHSQLISHLSPLHPGAERQIPHRYVLVRAGRDLVQTWMNRDGCQPADLGAVILGVLQQQKRLLDYRQSDPDCKLLRLEELTADPANLQNLIDELGLGFRATAELVATRHNASAGYWWDWTEATLELFAYLRCRYGHPEAP